ncbi:MAG: hypothetical protein KDC31_09560 [Saprospiraceae bacterium]|nr:hypothetical protein [Saprospiraceae bacterium]MBX7179320.1 hypothetical protein [Saprospiraceae bacterium]MCB0591527.1 hypothetical protein [Saprospiraceae bacterium]MCO5282173.1 hypothetical protein [Saprospiraceae bacterium]MCO6471597.1 hypothetical protein [Saprospiraceae bacterium]
MNSKNIFYILACISYCLIIGAAVYEHIAVWPVAFSEPPRSLTMFQGNYAIEPALFWKFIHPVTLTLFIITLGLNWKTERKKFILIPLITYIILLIVTFIYFVPELMSLIKTPYSEAVDEVVRKRGSLWITLSSIRLSLIVITTCILMLGLTKPATK